MYLYISSKGSTLKKFVSYISVQAKSVRYESTPLPLGAIWLAIGVNTDIAIN